MAGRAGSVPSANDLFGNQSSRGNGVAPKLRDLSRESVLITGGGRGIGRHLAREFAERGARKIVLWGRTEKCLKETTEEIRQMGTECHYFICDVGNREEVYQMAKAVREKVGDITILVNNAAVVHGKA